MMLRMKFDADGACGAGFFDLMVEVSDIGLSGKALF